jgi:hypothetical protein
MSSSHAWEHLYHTGFVVASIAAVMEKLAERWLETVGQKLGTSLCSARRVRLPKPPGQSH